MAQFTWRSIAFQERFESMGVSPDETFEDDRAEAVRVYDVAWTDRAAAVRALLGYAAVGINGAQQYILQRVTPHPHSEWKVGVGPPSRLNRNYLYATKCKIKGLGVPVGATTVAVPDGVGGPGVPHVSGVYKTARITTTYQSLPYDVEEDGFAQAQLSGGGPDESKWFRYVTKQIRPTTEYFTLPAGTMKQVGGNYEVINIGVGRSLGFFNVAATWHQVPEQAVPCKLINPDLSHTVCLESIIGTVNNAEFVIFAPTTGTTATAFNKATLLLLGAELKPYRSPLGARIYDITYMFKHFGPGISYPGDDGTIDVTVRNFQKIFRALPTQAPIVALQGWYEIVSARITGTNFVNMNPNKNIYDWGDHTKLFKPRGSG